MAQFAAEPQVTSQIHENAVNSSQNCTDIEKNMNEIRCNGVDCQVCGSYNAGLHYGAFICSPCTAFFKRSMHRETPYQCMGNENCHIKGLQKKKCPKCRMGVCLSLGMSRDGVKVLKKSQKSNGDAGEMENSKRKDKKKELKRDWRELNTALLPPCRICGDEASGLHYGVNTCEACKAFFKRSLKRTAPYKCYDNENCNMKGTEKNNKCPKCRFEYCLSIGMSKEGIRNGRYTLETRNRYIVEVKTLERNEQKVQLKASRSTASQRTPSKSPISSEDGQTSSLGGPILSEEGQTSVDGTVGSVTQTPTCENQGSSDRNTVVTQQSKIQFPNGQSSSYGTGHVSMDQSVILSNSNNMSNNVCGIPIDSGEKFLDFTAPVHRDDDANILSSSCQLSSNDMQVALNQGQVLSADDKSYEGAVAAKHPETVMWHSSQSKTPHSGKQSGRLDKIISDIMAGYMLNPIARDEVLIGQEEREKQHFEKKQIEKEIFGIKEILPLEEYCEIRKLTGLDVDGRQEEMDKHNAWADVWANMTINFARAFAGFTDLCTEDQTSLIKNATEVAGDLFMSRAFNIEKRLAHFVIKDRIEIYDLEDLRKFLPQEEINEALKIQVKLRQLNLSHEELVLIAGVYTFLPDLYDIKESDKVDQILEMCVECLMHLFRKNQRNAKLTFGKIVDMICLFRNREHVRLSSQNMADILGLQISQLYIEMDGKNK